MKRSYSLLTGLLSSMLIVGVAGTMIGLSTGLSTFAKTTQTSDETGEMGTAFQRLASDSAVAFYPIVLALISVLFVHMFCLFLKQSEADFLDRCTDDCGEIFARMRVMPVDEY